jgi:hypothetical protein
MTPIDAFLPHYDVHEVHTITIAGSPDAVYRAIRSLDFSRSPVIRGLFRMRGMPSAAIHLEGLLQSGFILLADHPGQCLVLGLVGRFWLPTGQLIPVAPEVFHVKENRTKRKRPCPATPCASSRRPEHAETRPPLGGLRQSAHFFPSATSMLGPGQRG